MISYKAVLTKIGEIIGYIVISIGVTMTILLITSLIIEYSNS